MAKKIELVMKSRIKDYISSKKLRSSTDDVLEAVNNVVAWYLDQAVSRCKANGRQTVRGHDVLSLK